MAHTSSASPEDVDPTAHAAGGHEGEGRQAARVAEVAAAAIQGNASKARPGQAQALLDAAQPLVRALAKALKREDKADTRLANGRRLADALLEGFLQAQERGTSASPDSQGPAAYLLVSTAAGCLFLSEFG